MIKLIQANLTDEVERKVMTIAEEYKAEGKIEGIAEGEAKATRNIARKLLDAGMPLKKVSEISGLSTTALQKLQSQRETQS